MTKIPDADSRRLAPTPAQPMDSAASSDRSELLYALRQRVYFLIAAEDKAKLAHLLRSKFFAAKGKSSESWGLLSDVRMLCQQIEVLISAADLPLLLIQWLRFGHGGLTLSSMLERARSGAISEQAVLDSVPSAQQKARVGLVLRSELWSAALPPGPPRLEDQLDSYDLGAVVAAIAADAQRGILGELDTQSFLGGFDAILAWELAARMPALSGPAQQSCRTMALTLGLRAADSLKVRLLRWFTDGCLLPSAEDFRQIAVLLHSIDADLATAEALEVIVTLVAGAVPDNGWTEDLLVQTQSAAAHCIRPSALHRANAAANAITAQLASAALRDANVDASARQSAEAEAEAIAKLEQELSAMTSPTAQVQEILRLAEVPSRVLRPVLSRRLPKLLRELFAASARQSIVQLSRAAVLTGCSELLGAEVEKCAAESPWAPAGDQVTHTMMRSLAAAASPYIPGAMTRWAEPSWWGLAGVPLRTLVASLLEIDASECVTRLVRILQASPPASNQTLALAEGLTLLLRQRPLADTRLLTEVLRLSDTEPDLAPAACLRWRARWTEVLDALGAAKEARRLLQRLLHGCKQYPHAVIANPWESLADVSPELARVWLGWLVSDLMNRQRDAAQRLMNAVTGSRMALCLPPESAPDDWISTLFLATVNLHPDAGRVLAFSFLARAGRRHGWRLTVEEKDDSLQAHAVRFCQLRLPSYRDVGPISEQLAAAAANLFHCGEVTVGAELLRAAVESLPGSAAPRQAALNIVEAFCFLKSGDGSMAAQIAPRLETSLRANSGNKEAADWLHAEASDEPWQQRSLSFGEATLTHILRRALLAGRTLPDARLGFLLEATLPHPDLADWLCAAVVIQKPESMNEVLDFLSPMVQDGAQIA